MSALQVSGHRVAYVVQHVAFEGPGVLGAVLADHGFEVRVREAGIDSLHSEGMHDGSLLVILGGPISVNSYADYPFLHEEKRLIRRWIDAGKPALGICLGAQLIADVLGATVIPMPKPEIGYAPISLTVAGMQSALAPLGGMSVLHWHGEQMGLPEGARHLASTSAASVQGFAVGDRVLALQFHLEVQHGLLERWLVGHCGELRTAGIDPRKIREQAYAYGPALEVAGRSVLRAWLNRLPAQV